MFTWFICRPRHCVSALFPGVYLSDAYYSILNNIERERWINNNLPS